MTKGTKIFIGIASVAVGAAAIWGGLYLFNRSQGKDIKTKEDAIAVIYAQKPNLSIDLLNKATEDYLIAWAIAMRKKESSFMLGSKKYSVETGRSI